MQLFWLTESDRGLSLLPQCWGHLPATWAATPGISQGCLGSKLRSECTRHFAKLFPQSQTQLYFGGRYLTSRCTTVVSTPVCPSIFLECQSSPHPRLNMASPIAPQSALLWELCLASSCSPDAQIPVEKETVIGNAHWIVLFST